MDTKIIVWQIYFLLTITATGPILSENQSNFDYLQWKIQTVESKSDAFALYSAEFQNNKNSLIRIRGNLILKKEQNILECPFYTEVNPGGRKKIEIPCKLQEPTDSYEFESIRIEDIVSEE